MIKVFQMNFKNVVVVVVDFFFALSSSNNNNKEFGWMDLTKIKGIYIRELN